MVLHSSLSAAVADAHRRDLLTVARRHRAETGPDAPAGSVLRRIARAMARGSDDRTEQAAVPGAVAEKWGAEKWGADRRCAVPR